MRRREFIALVGGAALHPAGGQCHRQAHRGGVRLDQGSGRPPEDPLPGRSARRLGLHLPRHRLQPGAAVEAAGGSLVRTARMICEVVGRWRIVEADLWDRDYLDLVEPAMMTIQADGHGEIAFGAMQASLDLEYSRS